MQKMEEEAPKKIHNDQTVPVNYQEPSWPIFGIEIEKIKVEPSLIETDNADDLADEATSGHLEPTMDRFESVKAIEYHKEVSIASFDQYAEKSLVPVTKVFKVCAFCMLFKKCRLTSKFCARCEVSIKMLINLPPHINRVRVLS